MVYCDPFEVLVSMELELLRRYAAEFSGDLRYVDGFIGGYIILWNCGFICGIVILWLETYSAVMLAKFLEEFKT